MPTKITTSASNPLNGEINVSDVNKIIDDYDNVVNISGNGTRTPQKRYYFDVNFDALRCLLEVSSTDRKPELRINMVLNLPDQSSCHEQQRVGDLLSILICGISSDGQSLLNTGDPIIVEGFKSNPDFLTEDDQKSFGEQSNYKNCCVQGKPKTR